MGVGTPTPSTVEITFPTFGTETVEIFSKRRFVDDGLVQTKIKITNDDGSMSCYTDGVRTARIVLSHDHIKRQVTYWEWRGHEWSRVPS